MLFSNDSADHLLVYLQHIPRRRLHLPYHRWFSEVPSNWLCCKTDSNNQAASSHWQMLMPRKNVLHFSTSLISKLSVVAFQKQWKSMKECWSQKVSRRSHHNLHQTETNTGQPTFPNINSNWWHHVMLSSQKPYSLSLSLLLNSMPGSLMWYWCSLSLSGSCLCLGLSTYNWSYFVIVSPGHNILSKTHNSPSKYHVWYHNVFLREFKRL